MLGTSVVLQGLHVMNQSTTGGSVRMERAFFQIWNWASSKKSQHCTQPEVGTFWQSYNIFSRWSCLQISPVPQSKNEYICSLLHTFCPFPFIFAPSLSSGKEQLFGYCSRLTPVCLSARGPVYIHPICLIPTFAPNRYYPPRHCNFN